MQIDIQQTYGDGYLDYATIEQSGLITLRGWYPETDLTQLSLPDVYLNDVKLAYLHAFRFYRADVAEYLHVSNQFLGLSLHFLDTAFNLPSGAEHLLRIEFNGEIFAEQRIALSFSQPHYAALLHTQAVAHREHIYGVGLPHAENPQEIIALSQQCQGKTLDFGCGSGFLVKVLRERGLEAQGIELEREEIRQAVADDIKDHIILYDGEFPLPFADNSFDTVFSTEVLEHIADYQTAVQEMARISKAQVIITVPDMSAIPVGFFHGVVPWHLLEATHVNFFSQNSLEAVLAPYFAQIEFCKIAPVQVNSSFWYTSIAAICRQPKG